MSRLTLLTNANVIPMTGPQNRAQEIALEGGRIVAVADRVERELRAYAKVVDLHGATVVPAFVDSHTHWLGAGLMLIGLRFDQAKNHEDLRRIVAKARKERGRGAWLVGLGAADNSMPEGRLPSREELDRWVSDSPLLLERADGHGCAVNSAALRKLELPADLRGLDADAGQLVGEAHTEALKLSQTAVARRSIVRALRAVSRHALSRGVGTAVCLEGFQVPFDIDVLAARVAGLFDRPRLRIFVQSFDLRRVKRVGQGRAGGCFEMALDGSLSSHTAALSEPFCDRPDTNGLLYHSDEKVRAFVEGAHLAMMQVALHAIGDRAIEQALRVYGSVLAEHPRADHRMRIEHCEMPRTEQIERMAKLGVHLGVQPAFLDMPTTPTAYLQKTLGKKRFAGYLPLRSYLKAGIDISGGSDAPVSPINPLRGIAMAINHPNRDQALTPYEALRIFTLGGARSVFEERARGTIEPGLDADLCVLDADPLIIDPSGIEQIAIKALYIGGKLVYSGRL
ncbi:MAG: amidohydrolase [Candidatus Alcyoniella australis]|nr:amidohydrolase [Candidatus Alcyoniella australis]